jgi:uncharacterized protein (DUF58 family)
MTADPPFPGWPAAFTAALERLAIAAPRPVQGPHPGPTRSRHRGRALEFADYRPYTPGDDPRLVDWRAFNRLGRLFLKQFEEERRRTLTLLVDASASLDWGAGETHKGRYARRLAAALAWISLTRHEPVQAYVLRDGQAAPTPPATSRAGIGTFLATLGRVRESGATDLASAVSAALARRAAPGTAGGPVILLSDLLDAGWAAAIPPLASSGQGILLQVLAPEEWEPSLDEEVELEDAETGERRPGRLGPAEIAAYRARLAAFQEEVRRRCASLGVVYLAINSETPLAETVLRHLPAAGVVS